MKYCESLKLELWRICSLCLTFEKRVCFVSLRHLKFTCYKTLVKNRLSWICSFILFIGDLSVFVKNDEKISILLRCYSFGKFSHSLWSYTTKYLLFFPQVTFYTMKFIFVFTCPTSVTIVISSFSLGISITNLTSCCFSHFT